MSDTNCPNCGAPIEGVKCKYCGTYLFNIADIDFDKPKYIRIPFGDKKVMFHVIANEVSVTKRPDPITIYADNRIYETLTSTECTLDIKLRVVPDDEGVLIMMKENDNE